PAGGTVPLADGGGEHRARAAGRERRGGAAAAARRAAGADPAGGVRGALSPPAFRRDAPARGAGPGARGRYGRAADGRAVLRTGLPDPPADAARAGADAAGAAEDRRLR